MRHSAKVPPWLKVLEYTNFFVGICAIVPLDELFDKSALKSVPILFKTFGVLNLFSCEDDMAYRMFTDLTIKRVYTLFSGNKVKVTFKSGAYLQDVNGAWGLHVSAILSNPDPKATDSILYTVVKFMKVTFPSDIPDYPPLPAFPKSIICEATGDPEYIASVAESTALLVPENAVVSESFETDQRSERRYAFFRSISSRKKTDEKPSREKTTADHQTSDLSDLQMNELKKYANMSNPLLTKTTKKKQN